MYQGQLLSVPGTDAISLWGPWMTKGGDHAVMTYEVMSDVGGGNTFGVEVWTKAREDRSSEGTQIASTSDFTNYGGTNFYAATVEDFDEMFRVKISFEAGEGGGSLIYRFLDPTWFNKGGSNS